MHYAHIYINQVVNWIAKDRFFIHEIEFGKLLVISLSGKFKSPANYPTINYKVALKNETI